MYLRSLELTNFRNFRRLAVDLEDGPAVIQGDNGQGKTNLLEAIELLAMAKSPRALSDRELIHWDALGGAAGQGLDSFARVRAIVGHEGGETRAEVLVRGGDAMGESDSSSVSKSFRVNGLNRRALEFVGTVNVVSFSPLDVGLLAGPPAGRRRYLDIMNSQVNRRYLYSLQRYQRILLHRNHLLRQLRGRHWELDDAGLPAWTEQMVGEGAFLIQERAQSVRELGASAQGWFRELGGQGQRLEIRYRPGWAEAASAAELEGEVSLAQVHATYVQALGRMEARERGAGVSLVGPHRDDLRFFLDGIDLHVYGSRGQQRLAALSLKLAEAALLERRRGSRPILLMDDALSELDTPRQEAVLRFVAGAGQSLLTVTSLRLVDFEVLPNAAVFQLADATLARVDPPVGFL